MSPRTDAKHAHSPSTDQYLFEALVQSLGENAVLVNDTYSIVRVFGDISPFIEMKSSSSLRLQLDLLRSPLREEARSLVTIALRNNAHKSGVRHLLAEHDQDEVKLDIYPIIAPEISERAALVVFNKVKVDRAPAQKDTKPHDPDSSTAERIHALENEVATTREALQQTIEELETSNEELQSLNEELQSTNEELQATNEELETSNEELQSTNEELITVNEELQVTASELSGRTGELTSVIESTPLAVVVMDTALQVNQATNAASKLFNISRPIASPHISQCVLPDGYPSLAPLCSEALRMGHTITREFNSNDSPVRLTCSPYFNVHGQILGVTMVSTELPGLAHEMEMVLGSSHFFVMHRKLDGTILRASERSAETLGFNRQEIEGKNLFELINSKAAQKLKEADAILREGKKKSVKGVYKIRSHSESRDIWLSVDLQAYHHADNAETTIYHIGTDSTELAEARDAAQNTVHQIELLQDIAKIGYWALELATGEVHWSTEVYRLHGVDPSEPVPPLEEAIQFYHPDDLPDVQAAVQDVVENGGKFTFRKRIVQKGGDVVNIESHGIGIEDNDGNVVKIIGVFREV